MTQPEPMVEIWRGEMLESRHLGHAVVCDGTGDILEAWGDPELLIYPRSSCKMLQGLPLIESGAARAYGLSSEHLALACASHQGADIHTSRVAAWLAHLGLDDAAFRCGPQEPSDIPARDGLIRAGQTPCRCHNNCSGKHAGFLTLTTHLDVGPNYVAIDHPVQLAVREAYEDMTGMTSPGYGIDGCSAPNFATSVRGLARAMAKMAAGDESSARGRAATALIQAMTTHPELVAGEGRACTELMRAMGGKAAIKTGAEAVFVAILPDQKIGMAVKIIDGGTRAAEAAIAALLIKYGVLDRAHPAAQKRIHGPIRNWDGLETGHIQLSPGFLGKA
jgi:L-asparaginase II